jgi:hypothetical protein
MPSCCWSSTTWSGAGESAAHRESTEDLSGAANFA